MLIDNTKNHLQLIVELLTRFSHTHLWKPKSDGTHSSSLITDGSPDREILAVMDYSWCIFSHSQGLSDMWQCPVKIGFCPVKGYSLLDKWPVGIWALPLWSMWMSCKLDTGSSNSYSFTWPNVHSTSNFLGKHCILRHFLLVPMNCLTGNQNAFFEKNSISV